MKYNCVIMRMAEPKIEARSEREAKRLFEERLNKGEGVTQQLYVCRSKKD